MDFQIYKQEIESELQSLADISALEKTNPVLEFLQIKAGTDTLEMSATDLRSKLDCRLTKIDVKKPGTALLPARRLYNLIKLFSPKEPVRFNYLPSGKVRVSQGGAKFELLTLSDGAYPNANITPEPAKFIIEDTEAFRRIIRLSSGFTGEDDSRFTFSSALFEIGPRSFSVKATDNSRFAFASAEQSPAENKDGLLSVLIPQKAWKQIASFAARAEKRLEIETAQSEFGTGIAKLRFSSAGRKLTVSTANGKFPNCDPVFNLKHKHKICVSASALKDALSRIRLVSDSKIGQAILDISNDSLKITTACASVGDGVETVSVKQSDFTGEPLRIAVNLGFVIEFLGAVKEILPDREALIALSFSAPLAPLELSLAEDSAEQFRYILSPQHPAGNY